MGKLFLFEARKLARQKSLYICFAIAVAMLVLVALVYAILQGYSDRFSDGTLDGEPVFGVAKFTKNTFSNCDFFLLLAVIVTLFCCNDYSNATIKNIYAKGYSRAKVYFSKYLFSLALSLVLAAACIIISYVIGAIFAKPDDGGQLAEIMVCQLITVIGYHGIFFSVSMMLTKVGGSLAINILAPMLFGTVLSLLTLLIQSAATGSEIDLGYIWFDSVFAGLSKSSVETETFIRAVLMSLIYAGAFVTLGYFVNSRKEV